MDIKTCISKIKSVSRESYAECVERFDAVAKPVGSLGKLEELLAQIAAIRGSADISVAKRAVLVFCADNGVVKRGVAQSESSVTTEIAKLMALRKASVCVMAKTCGAEVFPVDVGMIDTVDGLRDEKLMRGTDDITEGPAMSRETAERAVEVGIECVRDLAERGYNIIATGEAGIGNTTTSSAVCAALLDRPAREVTGRGAGLDDGGLRRKTEAVDKAVHVNRPDASDPLDVLHKVGGLDIAAMTGVFLGGALYRVPVVMDGFISGTSALLAVRMCPDAREYILPSHFSEEPGARLVLETLGFSPVIHANMRLGEGTGAVALFPLLDMACAEYYDAAKFRDINVEQYKRLS